MQARASRLSFNDIVKRLAATEETHPTFISRKVVPLPCNGAECQSEFHQALQPPCASSIDNCTSACWMCSSTLHSEIGCAGKKWGFGTAIGLGGTTSCMHTSLLLSLNEMGCTQHLSGVEMGSYFCLPAVLRLAFTSPRLQAELVERFVVVHGQIILNQFKNFPKKSVANSAFVSGLKGKMELRRHCKLYAMPRPKARVRVRVFPCPRMPSHVVCCSSALSQSQSCSASPALGSVAWPVPSLF